MNQLLRIENLSVSFHQYDRGLRRRTITPVTDMSLAADAGELVALVGESGAGKTLLGEAALGMLPANAVDSGRIVFRGQSLDPAQRRALAGRDLVMLPQSVTYLDPTSTVGAQVGRALALAGRSHDSQAVRRALADRDLDAAVARQYPHELSGGMARRVLLAMALAGRPSLVFADEPTPGLDSDVVRAIFKELREIADTGCAVVAVSHDLSAVLEVADRVVVCQAGRTVETVPPQAFLDDELTHPYARDLWAALPVNGFRLPSEAATHG